MKVYVIQLDGVTTMRALPLAAGLVVASARVDPIVREVARLDIVVGDEPPERVVAELEEPDVVGLSLYMWNEQVSLEVARLIRRAHLDCLVVAGGPSVPCRPDAAEDFLREHSSVDVLVFGEGEQTFREILRSRHDGSDLTDIPGIAFRGSDGRIHITPLRPGLTDFSDTASPYLDGTFDRLLERYSWRYTEWRTVAVCETNRGCPFTCTFCSAGLAAHSRVRELPLDRVNAELEWIAAHRNHYLFIADANFGIRPRDADIAQHLAGLKARTGYPGYLFFYVPKNARERHLTAVETLTRAGIGCQVPLSAQSFDDEVLAAVRRANMPTEKWLHLRDLCKQRGIRTYNELILGLPEQTVDSFASTVVKALSPPSRDNFYLYLCRIIPNTEMDQPEYRTRYGLETRRCRSVPPDPRVRPHVDEYEEIVVATRSMPTAEWRRAFIFGNLASAFTNLRLLDTVVDYLQSAMGADLKRYLLHLCDRAVSPPEGSVFADLARVFDGYFESILFGGPVLLPADDAGETPREAAEAVVAAVLRQADAFYDEVASVTVAFLADEGMATEQVSELFEFQRFATPCPDTGEPNERRFGHDWLGWREVEPGPELEARENGLRFVPPAYAGVAGFGEFIENHLAATRLGADTGVVVRCEDTD